MIPDPLWLSAKAVQAEVFGLPEGDRRAAIERACDGDRRLLEYVLSLEAARVPERDVVGRLGRDLDHSLAPRRDPSRWLGRWLGNYRTTALIGKGGMALVYRAEGADGARVAVKVLDRIAAGAGSLQRFERERRRLELFEHPAIARLIDFGDTEEGDPFLVMELVDGVQIDVYADQHRLDMTRRLHLLLRVCEPVGYAHRHGVIHRDVKPANVLIRSTGEPTILDFGIAKLMDDEGRARPSTVSKWSPAFTPLYASPEHVEGRPVYASSDVYSLGALSYRLLCGAPPKMGENAQPLSLLRVFESLGADRTAVAAAYGTDPDGMRAALVGPISPVLRKACSVNPASRHPTVDELAEDIRTCLA